MHHVTGHKLSSGFTQRRPSHVQTDPSTTTAQRSTSDYISVGCWGLLFVLSVIVLSMGREIQQLSCAYAPNGSFLD